MNARRRLEFIREFFTDEEWQELQELTGAAAAGPFNTPFAFQGSSDQNKKKRKSSAETAGLKVVDSQDDEETSSMKSN